MGLKRLSKDELIKKCTDIFYSYMSSSPKYYTEGKEIDCTSTPTDMLHESYLELIRDDEARIQMYKESLERVQENSLRQVIQESIDLISEEKELILKMNRSSQKKRREKLHTTEYSVSGVRIPLNKLINSFYDDLILEVLFYDDVATLSGKYDEYKILEDPFDKASFLRENTEITHIGLVIQNRNNTDSAIIGVLGEQNEDSPAVQRGAITLLKGDYADFSKLSLRDISVIRNNDLKQLLQSKIDLDKENMLLLGEKMIRGDLYQAYLSNVDADDIYIRYVCPSTKRVYYNLLNLRNLRVSNYFKEDNYISYLEAWWNITHLGASVEGNPVISC